MLKDFEYKYIAIEGNIGVGKTTLAKRLSSKINANLILEKFRKNHFLPLFYSDMDKYGLHVELSFLIDRFEDHNNIAKGQQIIVSDYFFLKTLLFAKINLDKHTYKIFEKVYTNFEMQAPKPDLVIFLKRDIQQLLKNIKNRKRESEQKIAPEYLLEVQQSYDDYFKNTLQYKVLSLDISEANLKKESTVEKIITLLDKSYQQGITNIKI